MHSIFELQQKPRNWARIHIALVKFEVIKSCPRRPIVYAYYPPSENNAPATSIEATLPLSALTPQSLCTFPHWYLPSSMHLVVILSLQLGALWSTLGCGFGQAAGGSLPQGHSPSPPAKNSPPVMS
jgi:hypothetical protein